MKAFRKTIPLLDAAFDNSEMNIGEYAPIKVATYTPEQGNSYWLNQ